MITAPGPIYSLIVLILLGTFQKLRGQDQFEQEWEEGGDEQRDCGGETQKGSERTNLQGQIQKLPGDAFFLILIARWLEKLSKVIVIILFWIDNMIQVDD